jgi:tetratricopeptide (TPR) repeat protein
VDGRGWSMYGFAMPTLMQIEKLMAKDPSDPFVLYAYAIALGKNNEHARAVEYFDRCLAADRLYTYAYYHKAKTLEAMGRRDEVKSTLTQGLKAAREARDGKGISEISGYLSSV